MKNTPIDLLEMKRRNFSDFLNILDVRNFEKIFKAWQLAG